MNSQVEGTIKGVSDFGAFVDFGAVTDGLVHKSQLSDDFVDKPADVVEVGQKVRDENQSSNCPGEVKKT